MECGVWSVGYKTRERRGKQTVVVMRWWYDGGGMILFCGDKMFIE